MESQIQWLTALGGAIFGAVITHIGRVMFDRYTRNVERRRYAGALAHEIRRISEKLEQRASSLDLMKDQYIPRKEDLSSGIQQKRRSGQTIF